MKPLFILLVYSFFSGFVSGQIDLDKIVSEFMSDNNLSYEKLDKLESIRLKHGFESKQWESAYNNWDKNQVTDSLYIEQFVVSFKDFRTKDLFTLIGNPKESILHSVIQLEKRGKLNHSSVQFVNSVVCRTVDNEEKNRADAQLISEHYQSFSGRCDTIREVAEFLLSLDSGTYPDNLKGLVEEVNKLDSQNLFKLKAYLQSKGYDNLDRRIIPELHIRKYYSGLTTMFKQYMQQSMSCIHWGEDVLLMFEPYYADTTLKNVLIADALLGRLRAFNIGELDNSTTGQMIEKTTSFKASEILLGMVKNLDFQIFRFPVASKDHSSLKKLIELAYNDIYFVYDVAYSKTHETIKNIDLESFVLSDDQRSLVEALQCTDLSERQEKLQKSLSKISVDKIDDFSVFKLAIYVAIVQEGFTKTTNWNKSEIARYNFDDNTIDLEPSKALTKSAMSFMVSELYKINKERYFNLDQLILTVSRTDYSIYPGIRYDLKNELRNSIERLHYLEDLPKYTRWVINFTQKDGELEKVYGEEVRIESVPLILPAENDSVAEVPLPEPIDFPDMEASFPGGTKAMKTWIDRNLKYPEISMELGDQGRVYVCFVVEVDGSISNVKIMRGGITPELNREAKRIVRSMPKWKPGELKGQKVRTNCRLPIVFSLDQQN